MRITVRRREISTVGGCITTDLAGGSRRSNPIKRGVRHGAPPSVLASSLTIMLMRGRGRSAMHEATVGQRADRLEGQIRGLSSGLTVT